MQSAGVVLSAATGSHSLNIPILPPLCVECGTEQQVVAFLNQALNSTLRYIYILLNFYYT
jgi:hypothetical protein